MCTFGKRESLALAQTDYHFSDFTWLLVLVISFCIILGILFFFCEMLSRTQKFKKPKIENFKTKRTLGKLVGYPELKQSAIEIPTVSDVVEQRKVSDIEGNLYALPPPSTDSKSTAPNDSSPPVASYYSRTIPPYRSFSILSPVILTTRNAPDVSGPSQTISSAPKLSDIIDMFDGDDEVVQKVVPTEEQMSAPPMSMSLGLDETDGSGEIDGIESIDETDGSGDSFEIDGIEEIEDPIIPPVSHSPEMQEKRITIPIKIYKQSWQDEDGDGHINKSGTAVGQYRITEPNGVSNFSRNTGNGFSGSSTPIISSTYKGGNHLPTFTPQISTTRFAAPGSTSITNTPSIVNGLITSDKKTSMLKYIGIDNIPPQAVDIGSEVIQRRVDLNQSTMQIPPKISNLITTEKTKELRSMGMSKSMYANSEENDSRIVAHNIMTRLFRGQQQSDVLFRQIRSLEYKVEFLTLEMMKQKKCPEKVTQGVQTNDIAVFNSTPAQLLQTNDIAIRYQHLNFPPQKNLIKMDEDVTFQAKSNGLDAKRHSITPNSLGIRRNVEKIPKMIKTTTTQIISLEAVPVTPTNSPTTPLPLLLPSRENFSQSSSFEDSVGESISMSSKSNSLESVKLPRIIEVQRHLNNYAEGPLKKAKLVSGQNNQIQNNESPRRRANDGNISQLKLSAEQLLKDYYDKSLYDTMTQLRSDCQLRIQENQNAQEFLYSKKELGLQNEVKTLVSSMESQGNALSSLHWKLSNLERNITAIGNEKVLLENCAQDMKLGWEADKRTFYDEKRQLEELLSKMRTERQELVKDYEHLLHAKVGLDSELVKYKVLVDAEEKR